jgi:dTDP-4-amino-4,6-dideoxygalactose transaminase
MVVDQLGLPADVEAFRELARERGIRLVEDAACAIGSRRREKPVGADGELVCFSFHPRKLVTTGDGGMVLTPSAEHAALLRRLRHHGMSVSDLDRHHGGRVIREEYLDVGFNYRMTDIQAAVGIEQLRRLPGIIAMRHSHAATYDRALQGHPLIGMPFVPPDVDWNVQTYAVRLRGFDAWRRDAVMQALLDEGIATRPGVMTAHREPAYRAGRPPIPLPISEAASDGSLALPLHGGMSTEDVRSVAATLVQAVDRVAAG